MIKNEYVWLIIVQYENGDWAIKGIGTNPQWAEKARQAQERQRETLAQKGIVIVEKCPVNHMFGFLDTEKLKGWRIEK